MLLTVAELGQRLMMHSDSLIEELQDKTHRYGLEERQAWQRSLPVLSRLLDQAKMQHFHVHIPENVRPMPSWWPMRGAHRRF